jgi:uncharacterized protein (TIGR02246 family)
MEDVNNKEDKESFLEIAHENFKKWNEALQTKEPEKVAELYTEDCTFLPTMSGDFKFGQEGAESYFEHFLQKDPIGLVKEEKIQETGPDTYIHSGMYDFEVGPADKREIAEARFTYVWQRNESGHWEIIHHHSSIKPKETKEKTKCPNCGFELEH